MTTERGIWLAEHETAATVVTVCHCGQELDCCTREHCPRCGTRLVAVTAA